MLYPLSECINKEVYEMYQDIPFKEIGSENIINGLDYGSFEEECQNLVKEEYILNDKVGSKTKRFILIIDNLPVGEVGIRTTLNDFWINQGSQIFYKIRNNSRGKGYGNLILKLALDEARKLGFKQARINCDDNNICSKKVILKNGGILDIKSYKTPVGTSSSYIIKL